ncbi:Uncharacterised protein [Vibrio cholerae]|nr:Uncharacterised protein [Vibrio cholerae]CSD58271.1 Uncharacterised protein [Vibrio cholerae]
MSESKSLNCVRFYRAMLLFHPLHAGLYVRLVNAPRIHLVHRIKPLALDDGESLGLSVFLLAIQRVDKAHLIQCG